jgi:hypothetical protein
MSATATQDTDRRDRDGKERIGDYSLVDRIGSGGMATVWRVRDPRGRTWALKEMNPPEPASRAEMTRRFRQEFEITSRLSHRNVVGVHEFFQANDTFHIVMEHVDGLDLRSILAHAGALDDGRLSRIALDIAAGLGAAHENGILHRDLKPENVLVSKRGQVKIADFGVARVVGTRLTATGIILGSPAYMSPEQLAGVSGQQLDGRADIYSLGVMLYELGEARDPLGLKKHQDLLTVLRAKREKAPLPFRHIEHADLRALLLACLQPDPADRPADIEAVKKALLRVTRDTFAKRDHVQELALHALAERGDKRKAGGKRVALPPTAAAELDVRGAPDEGRGVDRWFGPDGAERAGPPELPEPVLPEALTAGRTASRVEDLSVKRRGAGDGASLLSWFVLMLLGAAVVLFGVSASLTGSPLGLVEAWISVP